MRGPRPVDGLNDRFQVRSVRDLEATAKAIAGVFKTDLVVVVGSQSILVGWPEAPVLMRTSPEIDAYPSNARSWESTLNANQGMSIEASEMINGMFGFGTPFHEHHGFFVDGVDERTASLPSRWQTRACYREFSDGNKTVTVVSPAPVDLIAAKGKRLGSVSVTFS